MKTITSEITTGFLQCKRKGFLLLTGKESGSPHEIDEIITFNTTNNRNEYVSSLRKEGYKINIFTPERFERRVGLLVDVKLEADDLLASLDILTKATTQCRTFCYEPTLISGNYSIQFEDKLKLLFSAHVLTQLQGTSPKHGFIVTTGGAKKKITLENDYGPIIKAVDVLRHWASSTSAQAPRVILNKHCTVCQFRHQCRKLAEDLDDLSLLDRMTSKILAKYHKKGILRFNNCLTYFAPEEFKRGTRMRQLDLISNYKPWP